MAARLSLGLQAFPAAVMGALPDHCPLCTHRHTGAPVSLRDDPWHWLACLSMTSGELTRRHDAVVDAIARMACMVGAQVRREVRGLNPDNKQRPDLQIAFPGRMLLTDVAVTYSLTPHYISATRSAVTVAQLRKKGKYASVASRLGAELLNACVDACGGLASDASKLVRAIGDEGERWSAGAWSSGDIQRRLLSEIAVAVQRGNALTMLTAHSRATSVRADQAAWGGE